MPYKDKNSVKAKESAYRRHKKWINKPESRLMVRKNVNKYKIRVTEIVFNHYGKVCNCCGEIMPKFLTIDHVNNDGYMEKTKNGNRISGVHLYYKIIRECFPDKYQVLCMNCNWGKSNNKGICPHKDYG